MKRLYAAIATAAILVALIPSAVSADPVSKSRDHFLSIGCGQGFDGGAANVFMELSTAEEFQFVDLGIWFDPDTPAETEATIRGFTEALDITDDGATIEVHAVIPTVDVDGNPQGDADLTITVARNGEIEPILPEPGKTNSNDKTSGVEELLDGSAALTWDGSEYALECGGVVADVNIFTTNPRAFVSTNSGVTINCEWQTDTVVAAFGVTDDRFGYFGDAFLETPDATLFTIDAPPGSVTESGLDATFELDDAESAVATATFTPTGSPVTSTLYGATFRTKTTEQALVPEGSIEYSTGDTFVIDDEHCDAVSFENHSTNSQPHGPKGGPTPPNDRPEDAIELSLGSRFNTSNVGATPEPEVPILTCPEDFFDNFGRTLWYTIEGTGGPVTVDTAGSAIDTLIGVFLPTDSGFEEIDCIDDVEFEPVGATYQAAITIDTEEGVTYYVEVGGFFDFFSDPSFAEAGRIRITVR